MRKNCKDSRDWRFLNRLFPTFVSVWKLPNFVVVCLNVPLRIWEVLGLSLGQETDYANSFLWFLLALQANADAVP
jgi:hypothetical protein